MCSDRFEKRNDGNVVLRNSPRYKKQATQGVFKSMGTSLYDDRQKKSVGFSHYVSKRGSEEYFNNINGSRDSLLSPNKTIMTEFIDEEFLSDQGDEEFKEEEIKKPLKR